MRASPVPPWHKSRVSLRPDWGRGGGMRCALAPLGTLRFSPSRPAWRPRLTTTLDQGERRRSRLLTGVRASRFPAPPPSAPAMLLEGREARGASGARGTPARSPSRIAPIGGELSCCGEDQGACLAELAIDAIGPGRSTSWDGLEDALEGDDLAGRHFRGRDRDINAGELLKLSPVAEERSPAQHSADVLPRRPRGVSRAQVAGEVL